MARDLPRAAEIFDVFGRSLCAGADGLLLRFVEGALPREGATIHVVCDLQR